MNQTEIKSILKQTLVDSQLSRKEKQILNNLFKELKPNQRQIHLYRDIAFDLVRESSNAGLNEDVVDWLDEVMKLLIMHASGDDSRSQKEQTNEVYFSPGQHCPNRIIRLLGQAESSVDICVFTITDDRITSAILDAHDRHLKIRIITDNHKSEDLGSDADRLIDAGLTVRFDQSRHHMHHKFAIFDNQLLLTGSYNWTRSAAESNEENFIVTQNNHFLKKFSQEFENLWKKFV